MSRPKGARNRAISETEKCDLLKTLREKAEQGDAQAAGFLLLLAEIRPQRETRHGQA